MRVHMYGDVQDVADARGAARGEHTAPSVRHPQRAAWHQVGKEAMRVDKRLKCLPWELAQEHET